jgi:hypothetical protein
MSPRLFMLVWRPWSCSVTPKSAAAFTTSRVASMSAFDGVGSPEGWLCTGISAVQSHGLIANAAGPGLTLFNKAVTKRIC